MTSGDWVAIGIGVVALVRSGGGWLIGAFGKDQSRLQDLREQFIEFRAENRAQHEAGSTRLDRLERRLDSMQVQIRNLAPGSLGTVTEWRGPDRGPREGERE